MPYSKKIGFISLLCLGGRLLGEPVLVSAATTTINTNSSTTFSSVSANLRSTSTSTAGFVISEGNVELPLSLYGYANTVRLSGTNAKTIISIPVYPGLTPVSLKMRLISTPNIDKGFVSIEHDNTTIYTVSFPAPLNVVEVPLTGLKPKDNFLTLVVNGIFTTDDDTCSAFRSRWADVSDMRVVVNGTPRPPETLAQFFSPTLQRLNIYLGQNPTAEMITTALRLVSFAEKMGVAKSLDVTLYPSFVAPTTTFNDPYARSIVMSPGGEKILRLISTAQGWPYLYIVAPPGDWLPAILPLVDERTKDLMQVDILKITKAERATSSPPNDLSFEALGTPLLRLQGVGEMRGSVSVPQALFNRPIVNPVLHLRGVTSVLQKDGIGRLDTFFNNELLDSFNLPEQGGAFGRTVTLDNDTLRRDNQLDFVLTYTPPGGNCRVGLHNMVLDIQGTSTISVTSSAIVPPSFDRYPQVLLPTFDLVLENTDQTVLTAAARALVAWQHLSPRLLSPRVVWLNGYVPSNVPAVVVASDPKKLKDFDTFLDPDTFRLHEVGLTEDLVTARPFAVMQTFLQNETPFLVLSVHAWKDGLSAPISYLLEREGWYDAKGNIMVVTAKGEQGSAELSSLRKIPLKYGFWGNGDSLTSQQRTMYTLLAFGFFTILVVGAALFGYTYRQRATKK